MSNSGPESSKAKGLELFLLALVLFGLIFAGYKVRDNMQALDIQGAYHTNKTVSRWARDRSKYREIDLPFMLRPGYFQIDFTSNRSKLDLDVYAQDCLTKVFLDGKRVYKKLDECKPCKTFAGESVPSAVSRSGSDSSSSRARSTTSR